jgi:hypothetical protein
MPKSAVFTAILKLSENNVLGLFIDIVCGALAVPTAWLPNVKEDWATAGPANQQTATIRNKTRFLFR